MYEIGFTLLLGEGGPADPVQAIAWLEKAAVEDHCHTDEARRLLVQLYTDGSYDVTEDPQRAAYWQGVRELSGES